MNREEVLALLEQVLQPLKKEVGLFQLNELKRNEEIYTKLHGELTQKVVEVESKLINLLTTSLEIANKKTAETVKKVFDTILAKSAEVKPKIESKKPFFKFPR